MVLCEILKLKTHEILKFKMEPVLYPLFIALIFVFFQSWC